MNAGDIVKVNQPGEHEGRYGQVVEVTASPDVCIVEFEDDRQRAEFQTREIDFVRRGPFRGNPR